MNSAVVKKTQDTLGRVIKKPPLQEKLLMKPPFRYLHDIFTEVIRTTGFMKGLYEENEMNPDHVNGKEPKMAFLQKAIDVVMLVTGEPVSAKPLRIITGHEPEKTNELLQAIGKCCLNKLSSDEAVKQVLARGKEDLKGKSSSSKLQDNANREGGDHGPLGEEQKRLSDRRSGRDEKDAVKHADGQHREAEREHRHDRHHSDKQHRNDLKHHSSDKEKSRERDKEKSREREREKDRDRERQRDKNGEINSHRDRDREKDREREAHRNRDREKDRERESHRDKDRERDSHRDREREKEKDRSSQKDREREREREKTRERDRHSDKDRERQREKERDAHRDRDRKEERDRGKHRERELERERERRRSKDEQSKGGESGNKVSEPEEAHKASSEEGGSKTGKSVPPVTDIVGNQPDSPVKIPRPSSAKGQRRKPKIGDETDSEGEEEPQFVQNSVPQENGESVGSSVLSEVPPSRLVVRPSSARPAPFRVKRQDSHPDPTPAERLPSAKPRAPVIMDGKKLSDDEEEEEEDDQFLVEEAPALPADAQEMDGEPAQELDSEEEHGGLVKKILEVKKNHELPNSSPKSKEQSLVSEAARKKEREVVTKEIEKLRSSVQAVCRSYQFLAKILEYTLEDMDAMRAELHGWQKENKELAEALLHEQRESERVVEPLKAELAELEQQIKDQQDQNYSLKANVLRNEEHIQKMLAGAFSSKN